MSVSETIPCRPRAPLLARDGKLHACWASALFIGMAAGGALYAGTIEAARAGNAWLPPALAASQAFGVAGGALFAGRAAHLPPRWLGAAAGVLVALGCVGLLGAQSAGALVAGLLVGAGVGLTIAVADAVAAQCASSHQRGSTVLGVGLFAAVGAALSPLLVELARTAGASPYVPLIAVAMAAIPLASRLPGSFGATGSARSSAAAPFHLLFGAFVFGAVDNGVLALAPSHYAARGADGMATAIVGVGATGAAALMQVFVAARVEGASKHAPLRMMQAALVVSLACLWAFSTLPGPGAGALILMMLGLAIDLVYGAALVMRLSKAAPGELAGAAAAFVAACALGEVAGPLLVAASYFLGLGEAATWAPAAMLVACALLLSCREAGHA